MKKLILRKCTSFRRGGGGGGGGGAAGIQILEHMLFNTLVAGGKSM